MRKKLNGTYRNFEQTISILLQKAEKGPVSIKTFFTITSGKGKVLLLIFLSLVFTQIPGVAIFLGLFMCYLGVRIAFSRSSIWLPQILLRKKIPSYFLKKMLKQILNFLRFMKRWSHPRYLWAVRHPITRKLNGMMIALVGLSLAASPPIPLTGFVAFAAIFLIGIGLLNEDGIYIISGYVFALFYFGLVFILLKYCSFSNLCELFKCMMPG
jgi:hypothetical protein